MSAKPHDCYYVDIIGDLAEDCSQTGTACGKDPKIIGTTSTPGWDQFHNWQFYTKIIYDQVPREILTFGIGPNLIIAKACSPNISNGQELGIIFIPETRQGFIIHN